MTIGIITLLAAIVPFVIWLIKRGIEQSETPEAKNKKRYEQIDEAISERDSTSATVNGTLDLDELERLRIASEASSGAVKPGRDNANQGPIVPGA